MADATAADDAIDETDAVEEATLDEDGDLKIAADD